MAKIKVLSKEITVQSRNEVDYISLTDIARYKDAERTDDLIRNWLRNRNTIEFLGIWAIFQNGGAIFAPLLIGGIYALAGPPAAFAVVAVWLVASGVLMAVFGPETGGRAVRVKREEAETTGSPS